MRRSPAKRIAILSIFVALTAAFYPIPFCFLLPVILAGIWFDFFTACAISCALGVLSYGFSFLGGSPLSIAFIRFPAIAIVPRLFVGPAVYGVYHGLRFMFRKRESQFWKGFFPAMTAGMTGGLVNSALVLGSFALFAGQFEIGGTTLAVLVLGWLVSAAIEIVVDAVATPIVDATCRKVLMQTNLRTGR